MKSPKFAAALCLVGLAAVPAARAQEIPITDGSLAVGGFGTPLPGGGRSYGFSTITPPNSNYPLTYYGYGLPAYGPPGSPILGGGSGGYGYGFGYPAVGYTLSPVGGFGFATYGYPVGSTFVSPGPFLASPFVMAPTFGPYTSYSLRGPFTPSGIYNPLFPVGLTPLAVQSAIGERALVDRVGVSRAFGSTARSIPQPATSARSQASRVAPGDPLVPRSSPR